MKEVGNLFKSLELICKVGEIESTSIKEEVDWKKMMLGAVPGIQFPDNWDDLSPEEQKRRLDGSVTQLASTNVEE